MTVDVRHEFVNHARAAAVNASVFHSRTALTTVSCGCQTSVDVGTLKAWRVTSGIASTEFRRESPVWTTFFAAGSILSGFILWRGNPGTGKTTLALQFLLEGVNRGENGLYVTLSESERELRLVAKRHGWTLDKLSLFELVPPEASLDPDKELTFFTRRS